VISLSQGRNLHRTTQKNKTTAASIPRVKFETTILMFKWAKIFLALDHAASVKGFKISLITVIFNQKASY
jgi:hypothetical protein